jgi:CheY-like chemotaxis protein
MNEKKPRVLIVDDNAANRELLEAHLLEMDLELDFAEDGEQTMARVAEFSPDLILLDVMMPRLSGFEVCKQLKSNPDTADIMILMVTALNELGDIERAVEAGTNDFLSKPVTKVQLLKRVENMLKIKHISDENERLRRYICEMEEETRSAG